VGSHVQKRLQVRGIADLSVFTPDELEDVHTIVREYWYLDGSDMSRLSHFEGGWVIAQPEEGIPPKDIPETTFWLSAAPLTEEQTAQGQELWQRLHG
jgi:hypothetical protein